MNRLLQLLFALCWLPNWGIAQDLSLCQQVIGSTGFTGTENGLKFSYTVGELAILTLKSDNSTFIFTQGFQQPDVCLPVSTDTKGILADWNIEVFPNPVSNLLTVQFQALTTEQLDYRLFDLSGRMQAQSAVPISSGQQIDCSRLPAGMYLLQLIHPATAAFATVRLMVAN
jgi:Secretion system C-terminal sorting domain